jgi:hypothetical protein
MTNYTLKAESGYYHISPFGFISYAEDFYEAAISHCSPRNFSPVTYYLLCHSIELSLKSFLLLKGLPREEIRHRSMGHNLKNILTKCKDLGLSDLVDFSKAQTEEIASLNEWYCRKGFEYFELNNIVDSHDDLPNLSSVKELASVLISSLKEPCRNEANSN